MIKSTLNKFGLSTKLIAVTLLILVGVVAINYVIFMNGYRTSAEEALVEKAASFTALADETKAHVARLNAQGVFNTEEMLGELLEAKAENPNYDYTKSRLFGTIPVVAGWLAADEAAKSEGLEFHTPAFEARNAKNDPNNDPNPKTREARVQLLKDLESQIASGGPDYMYTINKEANTLHYMRAIRLDASCMMCHGDPADPRIDPDGDGCDPLGFPLENWKVGATHGAFEIDMPLDPLDAQVAGFFKNGMMFTVPLVVFAMLGFVLLLRALLTKPVKTLIDMIKDVATGDGDLTKRLALERTDEIGSLGKWFDTFLDNLHGIIGDVAGVTQEVAGAATEIAASSEELSAGMRQQQEQTSQVAAAMEEMSCSVTEVAKKAGEAASMSEKAGKQATQGGEVVEQTIEGMNSINDEVNQSAAAVGELGKRGEQIGEVISVINDIAEQTNLLALNAAIEAARAGEHGRGFAVVADEVRKLAERTTKATEEVAESINAIQQETTRAVERMESGKVRVTEGVTLAGNAGDALREIVAGSGQVAQMIQSIAAGAEQQSSAANEVSRSIESINAISNESAEGVRQAAEAATQLSNKAEQLQALVNRFKL
ncbi:MAG: methyl-accepting chemotaxis protein [Phycisphaeraceae bacterium]|nr:methyl-accepting chemotaxis protein [Phycisphaeraceae bacterium]